MRNYSEELKRVDPNPTVILKLTDDEEGPRFQRLYICFSALKERFKAAYRPVVGVDGCFLKGENGGQLLAAVGLDPNNNIYPISYAIVEGETKDIWLWFLKLVDSDLEIEQNQHTWTFMSDKQKGLIPAFEELFQHADNRFCVRHLHNNMKKDGFGGLAIKHAFWAAAKATRVEEFNRRMEELKEIDERAYICFILDARERPMIPLLETIRNLLMTRMVLNRDKDAGECIPMRADDWHYQIMGPFDQHTVDMQLRTCSCKKWDLNRIPCKHAICAICGCGQTGHNVRRCGQSGGTHESRAEENVMEPPTNLSDPQPTTQTQPQPQPTTQPQPNRRGKHEARRPSNVGINIGHMSNATTSVTINQGSANILVKGGVNYITLSNLKASVGNQDKGASTSTPHSMRPPLTKTPLQGLHIQGLHLDLCLL
ncbi:PREDICTED: uncharacterized protein LOC105958046 [Erythranthe guttata]|uniref:uncharacterized protein LOC105958046 n=1 Tax=Erythranthe guttata TaxID=4155 RepID=UPI00064D7D04|nr:PREDICTED: uncharacterized protein LOC105958046 [Erythranthe guttata]|eukprot:XP_012837504.1 PREDICTED: uncharacterized protein LOC105958046 [Erythranthe guttata]